jgi:hypothetical protein
MALETVKTAFATLRTGELMSSYIEREVIARGGFSSVRDLARKLMRYISAYSKTARPFQNGSTPMSDGGCPYANEFAATGH